MFSFKVAPTVWKVSFEQAESCGITTADAQVALQEVLKIGIPQWGDLIVNTSVNGYRNEGIFIFDGVKVTDLAGEIDDYGAIPQKFQVLVPHPTTQEIIPLGYWHQEDQEVHVTHNDNVWMDQSRFQDELLQNLREEDGVLRTFFTFNEEKYTIALDSEELNGKKREFFFKVLYSTRPQCYALSASEIEFDELNTLFVSYFIEDGYEELEYPLENESNGQNFVKYVGNEGDSDCDSEVEDDCEEELEEPEDDEEEDENEDEEEN